MRVRGYRKVISFGNLSNALGYHEIAGDIIILAEGNNNLLIKSPLGSTIKAFGVSRNIIKAIVFL